MRQSRAPGARRSPPPSPPRFPPAAGPGGAGRSTCRRWLPGRPAGSASAAAARRERCPPASRLPPGDARAPGGALTGLRRPRASRGVHGASGPASPAAAPPRKWTPAAGPGRPFHPRCRPEGGQTSHRPQGRCRPRGSGPRRHRCGATPQAVATRRSAGPAHPPESFAVRRRTEFSGTRCHLCFPMVVRGGLDHFPTWCKNGLTPKSGPSSSNKGH